MSETFIKGYKDTSGWNPEHNHVVRITPSSTQLQGFTEGIHIAATPTYKEGDILIGSYVERADFLRGVAEALGVIITDAKAGYFPDDAQ